MFADASAVVAIVTDEPERPVFMVKLEKARRVVISPVTIYEATLALARITQNNLIEARAAIDKFIVVSGAIVVPIDRAVGEAALDAFAVFGKGRHRASLNMGDCFAYACAKMNRVPLLCKGDDFVHTDIRIA
ncbi:MAG TPA: type II toxin-antitoxin system VapC family toxin [Aestuariivirga sp.]|nr:type II toxin-antitoxin system VapC family toxin [Aestuariivirga sp.]